MCSRKSCPSWTRTSDPGRTGSYGCMQIPSWDVVGIPNHMRKPRRYQSCNFTLLISCGGSSTTGTFFADSNTSLSSLEDVSAKLKRCNLCRLFLTSETTSVRCSNCRSVAYCGSEHKDIDWPHHKFSCKQWRKESIDDNGVPLNSENNSDSVQPSTSVASENKLRIIKTKDPDIQIIETGISKAMDTNMRNRRRVINKNGRYYKDHSKNLLFKITFQEHVKSLADRGLVVNQHQATALRLKVLYIAEHVIRSLNEYGWAVVDNFLGKRHCNKTYMEVERLYEKGMFSAGQLMDDGKNDFNPSEIRSDKILWFGNDNKDELVRSSVTIRLLIAMVDSVVVHFKNRIPPFEIAGRSKAMIAVYPGNGTRYVKHVDNPVKDGRCITTIYYCNEDWKLSEHGGTLRLYPETSEVPMDVDPQADRLIFFWSDKRIPHEVLPVFRHRYAITLWYFDVHERRKAMNERRKSTAADGDIPITIPMNDRIVASAQPEAIANGVNGRIAGDSTPLTTVEFAVPTRPAPGRLSGGGTTAQRLPLKTMTPTAGTTTGLKQLLLPSENGIFIKPSLLKPRPSDIPTAATNGNSDDTPFESLRNSDELSDVRRKLEFSSTQIYTDVLQRPMTGSAPISINTSDQQPLDLSRKRAEMPITTNGAMPKLLLSTSANIPMYILPHLPAASSVQHIDKSRLPNEVVNSLSSLEGVQINSSNGFADSRAGWIKRTGGASEQPIYQPNQNHYDI